MADPRGLEGARAVAPADKGLQARGRLERATALVLLVDGTKARSALFIATDADNKYQYYVEHSSALMNVPVGLFPVSAAGDGANRALQIRVGSHSLQIAFSFSSEAKGDTTPHPADLVARAKGPLFITLKRLEPAPESAIALVKGDLSLLDGDAELWTAFCLSLERLHVPLPAPAGRPSEFLRSVQDDSRTLALAQLYTQGYAEFQAAMNAGGVAGYVPMGLRLIEQYDRGNFNARANRLQITSKGAMGPGIYPRDELRALPYYWPDGTVALQFDGSTPRDLGFLSDLGLDSRIVIRLKDGKLADILLNSTKFAEYAIDQRKTLEAIVRLHKVLWREVRRDWNFERELGASLHEQLEMVVMFLAVESLALVLQALPMPQTKVAGFVVKTGAAAARLVLALLERAQILFVLQFVGKDLLFELFRLGNLLRQVELKTVDGQDIPADAVSRLFLDQAVVKARRLIVNIYSFAAVWAVLSGGQKFVAYVFGRFPPMPPGAGLVPAVADAGGKSGGPGSPGQSSQAGASGDVLSVSQQPGGGSSRGGIPVSDNKNAMEREKAGEGETPPPEAGEPSAKTEPAATPLLRDLKFETLPDADRAAGNASTLLEQRAAERIRHHCETHGLPKPFQNISFTNIAKQLLARTKGETEYKGKLPGGIQTQLAKSRRALLTELGFGKIVDALVMFYANRTKAAKYLLQDSLSRQKPKVQRTARDLVSDLERWEPPQDMQPERARDETDRETARDLPEDVQEDYLRQAEAVRLERELRGMLDVVMGNARPDNVIVTETLDQSAVLDPTERLEDPMHLLKLVCDRELLLRLIELMPAEESTPLDPRATPDAHVAGEIYAKMEAPHFLPSQYSRIEALILRWFGAVTRKLDPARGIDPALVKAVQEAQTGDAPPAKPAGKPPR